MTTVATIRNIAAEQLLGKTLAGARVFTPRTYPTWDGTYPMIFLQPPDEDGSSQGPNGAPAYVATGKLLIEARVQQLVLPLDAGAVAALADLELLLAQIKRQIINNPAFWNAGLQEFGDFHSQCEIQRNEMVLGEVKFSIDMIYRQEADEFFQEDLPYLEAIEAGLKVPDGTPDPGVRVEIYPSNATIDSLTANQATLNEVINIDLPGAAGGQTTPAE